MKTLKNLFLILTITAAVFTSTSCSKDEEDPAPVEADKIVGTWELKESHADIENFSIRANNEVIPQSTGTLVGKDYQMTLTFTEDPNKAKTAGTFMYTGTYILSNGSEATDDDLNGAGLDDAVWAREDGKIVFKGGTEIHRIEVLESTEATLKYKVFVDGTKATDIEPGDLVTKGSFFYTWEKK